MIVKMRRNATHEEVLAVETKLNNASFKTGRMQGDEITVIGVYGDITSLPREEISALAGVEELIRISKGYKRAAQKGSPENLMHLNFPIGDVNVDGTSLVVIAGPCSVESERQIMRAAEQVKESHADVLRGGVVKYRSSPYSGWEGIGSGSDANLKRGLNMIVKAGKEYQLPTVVEVLDPAHVSIYEDAGVNCLQIGEPNSKNQALLDRLRTTPLPVIHKRGNSMDIEAYLLWVERIMAHGKENVLLCERGISACNKYTRNTLDIAAITALHQLSCLRVAIDPSHGTGIRNMVFSAAMAGIAAHASVVMVETHPNPFIAKSDGFQQLFPEQLYHCVPAWKHAWTFFQSIAPLNIPSVQLENEYERRMKQDWNEFFGENQNIEIASAAL